MKPAFKTLTLALIACLFAGCSTPTAPVVTVRSTSPAMASSTVKLVAPPAYRGTGAVAMRFHFPAHRAYHALATTADIARLVVTLGQNGDQVASTELNADQLTAGTSVSFTDLAAGAYDLRVSALAADGTSIGEAAQSVTVVAGQVSQASTRLVLVSASPAPGAQSGGIAVDVAIEDGPTPASSDSPTPTPSDVPSAAPSGVSAFVTAEQKRRAEQLVSLFENNTPEIQYGYAEVLGDGRGMTVGRGFTTATGDALDAVEHYTAKVPQNGLAGYLPSLRALAQATSDATTGLDGFAAAWAQAAKDPAFRAAQDEVVDATVTQPTNARCAALGLSTALSWAVMDDTVFTHGLGDDQDGTDALIARTSAAIGGAPKDGIDENAWLQKFLEIRKADMVNAYDPATRQVWAEAAGRCDVYADLLKKGNLTLDGPIVVNLGDYQGTIQ